MDVINGEFLGHNDRQLQAIANACVTEMIGDDAGDHEVRWQLQSDLRHLLICAIPRAHVSALAQVASANGLRLGSVQPDFALEWNRHAGALKAGSGVFAVASGADAAIAWVTDGVISSISLGPLTETAEAAAAAASTQPHNVALQEEALHAPVEIMEAKIDSMLSGFGIKAQMRADFTDTQPRALNASEMLDVKVDRLLAGLGQDAAAQSAFVLVTPDVTDAFVSSRWTVTSHSGVAV
jgi:hypothetical protein